jgi:hypothetical protein
MKERIPEMFTPFGNTLFLFLYEVDSAGPVPALMSCESNAGGWYGDKLSVGLPLNNNCRTKTAGIQPASSAPTPLVFLEGKNNTINSVNSAVLSLSLVPKR